MLFFSIRLAPLEEAGGTRKTVKKTRQVRIGTGTPIADGPAKARSHSEMDEDVESDVEDLDTEEPSSSPDKVRQRNS